jgi:hypothetical protein
MFLMPKNDNDNMTKDLIVTGGHSLLVDQLTDEEQQLQLQKQGDKNSFQLDDKLLLLVANSPLFEPMNEKGKPFKWYHFCLEPNNYNYDERFGVYANGILVETPSENQLNQF